MALVKTEAVVLRAAKMGETSKLLTLYSQNSGLIKLIAKGVRSSKSRFGGVLEPLNVVEVVYYEKSNRELQLMSQAAVVASPKALLKKAEHIVLAMACCELVSKLQMQQDSSLAVYSLLRATLAALDGEGSDARWLFFAFQLRLLDFLGFAPGLQKCSHCACAASLRWQYDLRNAQLACANCAQDATGYLEMSDMAVGGLRVLAETPLEHLSDVVPPQSVQAEIYRFLTAFYKQHVDEIRELKSIEVLIQMKTLTKDMAVDGLK